MIYILRYLSIALYTVFWGSVASLSVLVDRTGDWVIWSARQWIRWIFTTCRIRTKVSGLDNIRRDTSYVVMSNHQSVVDIGALIGTLPVPWRFVAKREIARIPFLGWALALSNQIVIDRANPLKAVDSLRAAVARIREGTSVIIFPEGTRSSTGDLQPFKSGGFHLAIEAGVPILPVSISGSGRIAPKGSLRVESGTVEVVYGVPISTSGMSGGDRHVLRGRVREAILAGFGPKVQVTANVELNPLVDSCVT